MVLQGIKRYDTKRNFTGLISRFVVFTKQVVIKVIISRWADG